MPPQQQYSNPNQVLQEDFTLLDVIGGANISVMHPSKPIVAYTSGKFFLSLFGFICFYRQKSPPKFKFINNPSPLFSSSNAGCIIIVYDLMSDVKI